MSYIDFKKLINSFGYKSFKFLWYRNPRKALSRGLKPLNSDFNILQLAEVVFGFDVIDVYMNQGVIDTSSNKLNDVEDDDVVVIDWVEAKVEAVVEGEVEVEVQGDEQTLVEVQVEAEVQVDEQGLVEAVGEADVQAKMEVEVQVHEQTLVEV